MNKLTNIKIATGKLARRTISFHSNELRATGARVRKVLFDWLRPFLDDISVLELFAGSGILGLEALSNGAKECVGIELAKKNYLMLQSNIKQLNANYKALHGDYKTVASKLQQQFDLIFIDPPFDRDHEGACIDLINKEGLLTTNGILYLEGHKSTFQPPKDYDCYRFKTIANVSFGLFTYSKLL